MTVSPTPAHGTGTAVADGEGLRILRFATTRIDTTLEDGRRVVLEMADHPDDDTVTIRIVTTDGGSWPLILQLPAWATEARAEAADRWWPPHDDVIIVRYTFVPGDEILLHLKG